MRIRLKFWFVYMYCIVLYCGVYRKKREVEGGILLLICLMFTCSQNLPNFFISRFYTKEREREGEREGEK